MDVENNISENREGLTMWECRRLRTAIGTITCTPLLTREEYLQIMGIVDRVLARIGGKEHKEEGK